MDETSSLYDETIALELSHPDWICPNVTKIVLENNPALIKSVAGKGFSMVVNKCTTAVKNGDA